MKIGLRKIDAIIIVIMIAIAGFVFYKIGFISNEEKPFIPKIEFEADFKEYTLTVKSVSGTYTWSDLDIIGKCDYSDVGKYVMRGDKIKDCVDVITIVYKKNGAAIGTWEFPPIPELPESLILPNLRDVSPEDEGVHFKTIANTREWWYFTVVFDQDSDLPGWTATIGFLHMAWGDLKLTLKPDVMDITLHSPDGKEYGGIINKKRGGIFGLLGTLTLNAKTPGVDISYGKSFAKGKAPKWTVYAVDDDIDEENEIILDLTFFAPSSPLWIHSNRLIDKGEGKIANYIFTGCEVTGSVILNGLNYTVKGIGHHEHSWSPGFLQLAIKGWDWCQISLENGWSIYYSKYYLTRQILSIKTTTINPLATLVITDDKGKTITILDDIDITIEKSDKLFLLLKIPTEITIKAKPKSLSQPLLKSYNIRFELNIKAVNTLEKTWRFPTYVGMKVGLCTANGKISWSDNEGDHLVKLEGTASAWFMRSF